MKLLVVRLSALGDAIQALPAIAYIKRDHPSVQIDWLIEERNSELIVNHPLLERVYLFRKEYFKSPVKFFSFVRTLRKTEYDGVIDFQGLLKSGILVGLSRGRYKFGYANHREGSPFFYNVIFKAYSSELHVVRRYILLAKKALLYLNTGREVEIDPSFEIPRDIFIEEEKPSHFYPERPFLICVPYARGMTRIWPKEKWGKLVEILQRESQDFDILFIGGKDVVGREFFEELAERKQGVYSLIGKIKLKELVWLMKRAVLVISVDTGPMHLASLLNRPIVALFGATSSKRSGPWSEHYRVLQADLPCAPCFKRYCREVTCMEQIEPKTVAKTVFEFLSELSKITQEDSVRTLSRTFP